MPILSRVFRTPCTIARVQAHAISHLTPCHWDMLLHLRWRLRWRLHRQWHWLVIEHEVLSLPHIRKRGRARLALQCMEIESHLRELIEAATWRYMMLVLLLVLMLMLGLVLV
jgi:hypothetical protein